MHGVNRSDKVVETAQPVTGQQARAAIGSRFLKMFLGAEAVFEAFLHFTSGQLDFELTGLPVGSPRGGRLGQRFRHGRIRMAQD